MDGLWFFTIVIGPILMLAVFMYVTIRYWNRRKGLDAYSDRKARELRNELEREDEIRGEGRLE